MDFLKVLMVYMSLLFAASVQSAPPPGEAPETTKVPEVVVAQQGYMTPAPSEAKVMGSTVITPDPNVTPTPTPVPTIKPNPKYTTLRFGDRGANVKKMQQKLIELGYLTGSADGAFGYQTLNAVRAFQKANGLSVDGDAGSVTLTQLFENPDVARAPGTATPVPDEEKTQEIQNIAMHDASAWLQMDGVTMLLNGKTLALVTEENGSRVQGRLHVWLLGAEPYVCLNELAAAADGWTIKTAGPDEMTLTAAGYALRAFAPGKESDTCKYGYQLTADGMPAAIGENDAVYMNDRWLVSGALLRTVLSASVTWEAEESTLILQIADKTVAQSAD